MWLYETEAKVFVKGSMYLIKPFCVLWSDKANANAVMCVLRSGQGRMGEMKGEQQLWVVLLELLVCFEVLGSLSNHDDDRVNDDRK